MSQAATTARPPSKTAAEIGRRVALSDGARALLRDDQTPRQFLDLLIARGLHADAVRVLAHGLPRREAAWWAVLSVERATGPDQPPPAAAALTAARAWVAEPASDERRRAALPAAEAVGFDTPAGLAALAVTFSGGSLAPPDLPPVPPADHLTAEMVAAALALAAVAGGPEHAPARYADFLALGLDIGAGKVPPPAPRT